MSFTDNDLKRLKEALSGELPRFSYWAKADLQVLVNLIARLEAAEDYVALVADGGPFGTDDESAYKAWRKSAGKS